MFLHPAGITPTPASGRCALRHWRGEGCPGALEAADTACLGLLKGDWGHSSSALIPREHPTHLRPGLLVGTADRSPKLGLAIEGVYFSSCVPASKSLGHSRRRYSGSPEPDTVNALNYMGLVKTAGLEPFEFAIKTRFC